MIQTYIGGPLDGDTCEFAEPTSGTFHVDCDRDTVHVYEADADNPKLLRHRGTITTAEYHKRRDAEIDRSFSKDDGEWPPFITWPFVE